MFKFFSMLADGATTEYQISNRGLSDFLHTYYCDFLNFLLSSDNAQWVVGPAGIAVPQKRHCFCFSFLV